MIKRITLHNYMSHAHTVLDLAAGVTALVGPNNCGKSAVVAALQTLCGGHDGDFMVRHGERECHVEVETDDGHVVRWQRIKGKPSYVIDGTLVSRIRRGNLPDALPEVLRLSKVQTPGGLDEIDVHFGEQKSPIFLIDNERRTASLFSTASDAEKLFDLIQRHKDSTREAQGEQKSLQSAIEKGDAALKRLAPLEAIELEMKSAAEAEAGVLAGAALCAELAETERRWHGLQWAERKLAASARIVENLPGALALEDDESPRRLVDAMDRSQRASIRSARLAGAVAGVGTSLELAATDELKQYGLAIKRTGEEVVRLQRLQSALSLPTEQLAVEDPAPLAALCRMLGDAALAAGQCEKRALAARGVPSAAPELTDIQPLVEFISRLEQAAAALAAPGRLIEQASAELAKVVGEVDAWAAANPLCPLCGSAITRDALLGGHAHAHESGGAG